MFTSMNEILHEVVSLNEKKIIVVAAAHDAEVLDCAIEARKLQLADFILIGRETEIRDYLVKHGEQTEDWKIIDSADDAKSASLAAQMVREGTADIPMKGILHTAVFMRAMLNKETGLVAPNAYVSAITVAEIPDEHRLILVTDPVMSITPNYSDKVKITKNAVDLAHALGMPKPKVAFLSAVEVVNPAIPSSVDAALLSKAGDRGQLGACVCDGPLAFDVAVSQEAANIKNLTRSFEGGADILVVPDLASGNILDKAMRYFAHFNTGSVLMGTKYPVVATSRSDGPATKLNTIALAVLYSHARKK